MLEVKGLQVAYGDFQVLWGIDLMVREGEIVAILGPNGSGKSTVMNAISGIARPSAGSIWFCGERIDSYPIYHRPRRGLVHVLERHHVFNNLTVLENLIIGAMLFDRRDRGRDLERVYALFPLLRERQRQRAGSLSGGEQQMVAIGRGIMGRPRLLMLDEPTLGLSPLYQGIIKDTIRTISGQGITVLMIEQHVQDTLSLAHRGYILESGQVVAEGTGSELLSSRRVQEIFLGV